jgi:hypothetical protein
MADSLSVAELRTADAASGAHGRSDTAPATTRFGWLGPGSALRRATLRAGDGFALLEQRTGSARLRYRGSDADAARCAERQLRLLQVIARAGGRHATLREDACRARGAPACDYRVSWGSGPHGARTVISGVLCALALVAATWVPAWGVVAVGVAGAWAVDQGRARRARRQAQADSAAASRMLITRALERSGGSTAASPILEQAGEFWRISYAGETIMLRHSRGLTLLGHLLRSPGVELHVRDLDAMTPSGGSPIAREAPAPEHGAVPIPGDAGEILDQRARDEYRRRIQELQEELEDAERCHDLGRSGALRIEIEQIAEQLRAGTAAGGRARRASADVERLRIAITRRIRSAIAQIAKHHPALGAHLAATVTTGNACAYGAPRVLERDEPPR